MNILVVCQYFYPEQFRVNDICAELVSAGHNVTVLTGLPNYPAGVVDPRYRWFHNYYENINGVQVIRTWLLGRGKGIKRLTLNYISFAALAMVRALFIKKDFDLVLVYQLSPVTMALPGILLRWLTGKPLVIYCHDLWPESLVSAGIKPGSCLYKAVLGLSKWIYRQADVIFTSSQLFEEYFRQTLKITTHIVHLPVYAEALFENIPPKLADDDDINLVFAGNIGEMQSIETILYAANELKTQPHIKFHFVGDGSSKEKCEMLARQLQLDNVYFHGRFPIEDMPRFYQMADAFLVTLKANQIISYTLPNKVQSYMAAGKPIIGAINGETNFVLKAAQCGLCGPAEDYQTLASNIQDFAEHKERHHEYGKNARAYYHEHFSKSVYMEHLEELLNQIVHRSR